MTTAPKNTPADPTHPDSSRAGSSTLQTTPPDGQAPRSPIPASRSYRLSPERYTSWGHVLLVGYCLTAALSIAAGQALAGALVLLWLLPHQQPYGADRKLLRSDALSPLPAWFAVTLLSAIACIDPARSVIEALKSGAFLLFPIAVAHTFLRGPFVVREQISRIETYVAALILGQCIAAVHTLLADGWGVSIPLALTVPGAVTESGQLVLVVPLLLLSALFALSHAPLRDNLEISVLGRAIPPSLYAGVLCTLLLLIAWPGEILGDGLNPILPRTFALLSVLILAIPPLRRGAPRIRAKLGGAIGTHEELFQLLWPASALLVTALLINLKRGPWLGVFVELVFLGFLLSRKLLFGAVVVCFVVLLALSPTRTRLAELDDHFNIQGGRKVMWDLGEELIQRYPIGLGVNNARYIRQLDPSIPPSHRHLHNNLLNVAVETGWLGLAIYLWWMFHVFFIGIRCWSRSNSLREKPLRQFGLIALCISAAFLGWQASGLVEYNFGDGEIRLIAFFFMGLIAVLDHHILNASGGRAQGGSILRPAEPLLT